jgi:hypothetical protein
MSSHGEQHFELLPRRTEAETFLSFRAFGTLPSMREGMTLSLRDHDPTRACFIRRKT